MFNPRRNRKGFTIIELIVVIAIIAILAAIAIPMFIGLTDKANTAVAQANAHSIATAVNSYNAMNPSANAIDTAEELASAAADGNDGVLVGLWPEGIGDNLDTALGLLDISNGIWVVDTSGDEGEKTRQPDRTNLSILERRTSLRSFLHRYPYRNIQKRRSGV